MIYGSVCSGIEAATAAWHPLGWKAAWYSEIEPFPSAVLAHHYPETPNLGDMTNFKEWPDHAIDLLVGGTPCQSFSVAGLRNGLDDPRGNLMLTFGAIAGRYRPLWLVWENVPGVLSSSKGKDFGSFLGLITGQAVTPPADGWSNSGILPGYKNAYGIAWRTLDAQYFGVPQRRRRVFVVGYLGDWRPAAAVLFERHSLQGDTPPSRGARTDVAGTIDASLGRSRGAGQSVAALTVGTLNANGKAAGSATQQDAESHMLIPIVMETGQSAAGIGVGIGTTLNCNHEAPIIAYALRSEGFDASEDGTGRGTPILAVPILEAGARTGKSTDDIRAGIGIGDNGYPMFTLQSGKQHAVCFDTTQITSKENRCNPQPGDPCHPFASGAHAPAIAFSSRERGPEPRVNRDARPPHAMMDKTGAIDTIKPWNVATGTAVRRFTPRECERLQDFEDDYTRIPGWTGWRDMDETETPEELRELGLQVKKSKSGKWRVNDPDGVRYKAIGNSMARPVMHWIGQRIEQVYKLMEETK